MRIARYRSLVALLGTVWVVPVASADVGLRVDARPLGRPMEAYVLATDDSGAVAGLVAEDFEVSVDGQPIPQFRLVLPPKQDPTQHVSVVIVTNQFLRSGPAVDASAFSRLIKNLVPGDFASVVLRGYGVNVDGFRVYKVAVLPFREIDGGDNSDAIVNFLEVGPNWSAIPEIADGSMTPAVDRALDQFELHNARLPAGPRAIVGRYIVTTDLGAEIRRANQNAVSFFTRHQVAMQSFYAGLDAKLALAENTGGVVVETVPGSGSAIRVVESWLIDGYRLTLPAAAADDCGLHMLEVTVSGQSTSKPFSRCDAVPDPLEFPQQHGVEWGSMVVSDARRVRGLGSPAPVSVFRGEYSIGCGQTFTSAPGYVHPGEAICVRHHAATRAGKETATVLVIGGVASVFQSYAAL